MHKNYDFGTYRDEPVKLRWMEGAGRKKVVLGLAGVLGVGAASVAGLRGGGSLTAITFASTPGVFYVPARDLATQIAQPLAYDSDSDTLKIGDKPIPNTRKLVDGTNLVRVADAEKLGAEVTFDQPTNTATLKIKDQVIQVQPGEKKVEVDQSTQHLKAYQGTVLVLDTKVSTGRPGHRTPNGKFKLGPEKDRMHYSRLYENAPMPYSVQVDGNVFIHGFTSVPNYPASHGCIRMPLTKGNPAKWFFNWVDVGTTATISGSWHSEHSKHRSHRLRHRRHRRG